MSDYAKGFKDGFAAGLEEGKKIVNDQWVQEKIKTLEPVLSKPQPRLDDYVFGTRETCPKCGIKINGAMGYVCPSINCPVYFNAVNLSYANGIAMTGAVGSKDPSSTTWLKD